MRRFRSAQIPKKVVIGLFATLAIIPMLSLPPYVRAKRSERWPTTDGVISANWLKVIHNTKNGSNFYRPEIEYHYRVAGKDYVSARISFGFGDSYVSLPVAQQVLDRYPMRAAVKVSYDPADPPFAVLQPGRTEDMEFLYKVQLGFIGVFGLLLLGTWLWYQDPPQSSTVARASGNPQ